MKIEEGKFYKTREGKKVGPATLTTQEWSIEEGFLWALSGPYLYRDDGTTQRNRESNLVSEWPNEGPVRDVTRKEIVPGVYGIIHISDHHDIRLVTSKDPAELRAAAAVLSQLAEALEQDK